MNWIKITEETELPHEANLLLFIDRENNGLGYTYNGELYILYPDGYMRKDFTHYAIITPPKN